MKTGLVLRWLLHYDNAPRRPSHGRQHSTFERGTQDPFANVSWRASPAGSNNEKRHLAGSLHWRTGTLLLSPPGTGRNAQFFLAHLDDLRSRLRGFQRIRVICENARFHDCKAVREYSGPQAPSDRAALPAQARSRNQTHRARLVATARDDYSQPSLPDARRPVGPGVRLGQGPPHVLLPNALLLKHLQPRRLAQRSAVGTI